MNDEAAPAPAEKTSTSPPPALPPAAAPLWGNETWQLIVAGVLAVGGLLVGRLLRAMLGRSARMLASRGRPVASATCQALGRAAVPALGVVGVSMARTFILLPPIVAAATDVALDLLFVLAVAYALWRLVDVTQVWLATLAAPRGSRMFGMVSPLVTNALRGAVVVLALAQALTVVSDKPLTSVLAGLGIGGIAIGLAAQDTLKNVFGSLMIFADRPFEMGDRIAVGDVDGSVESVGFRSTRIRTLDGDLVTYPNGELAAKPIKNFARRQNLRRTLLVELRRGTTPEKLDQALAILRDILQGHDGQPPDLPPRVHFTDFKEGGFVLSATYWRQPPDHWAFMDLNERVNREVLRRFSEAGIEFALPGQALYVTREVEA